MEFVSCYFRRWKIETTFLELKSWFQLTHYKLSTLCAIERHFACCLVAHSILQGQRQRLAKGSLLALFIRFALRKIRNIRQITFLSLKCF